LSNTNNNNYGNEDVMEEGDEDMLDDGDEGEDDDEDGQNGAESEGNESDDMTGLESSQQDNAQPLGSGESKGNNVFSQILEAADAAYDQVCSSNCE
jgi:hypothetical protein